MPDLTADWPWGIKGTHLTQDDVRRYLSAPLVILLGDRDIDPKAPSFSRGKTIDKQGITRLARGVYFFNHAQSTAEKLDTPFAWQIRTIPGAPHGGPLVHAAAIKILIEEMNATRSTLKKNEN